MENGACAKFQGGTGNRAVHKGGLISHPGGPLCEAVPFLVKIKIPQLESLSLR